MNGWKMAGLVTGLAAMALSFAVLPGSAQRKNDRAERTDAAIGFVDLGQVTDQVRKTPTWAQMAKRYDDERTKFQNELSQLNKIRYLNAAERDELAKLRAKPTVSDAERARINELESRSDKQDQEASMLAGIEKPTEEQAKRIQQLAQLRQDAVAQLQDEGEKRKARLLELEAEAVEQMQQRILDIVADVSKSRGVTLVVDRQFVLYGGQDLTENVLVKLGANSKK